MQQVMFLGGAHDYCDQKELKRGLLQRFQADAPLPQSGTPK
tara:strand:+ start:596 stop:718 length:123 start_codon:yes stop_codon:yes gene_type:complete